MSKLIGVTIALVVAVLGVAIASLVFDIMAFNKLNTPDAAPITVLPYGGCPTTPSIPLTTADDSTTPDDTSTTSIPVISSTTAGGGPSPDDISTDPAWKEAADRILATADFSVDPCEDFYQFACGKYIQNTPLDGQSKKSTYDETQYQINIGLADYLDSKTLTDLKSNTEKWQKNFLDVCVADGLLDPEDAAVRKAKWTDLSKDLNDNLGFPLLGVPGKPKDTAALFSAMGAMEKVYTGGPLMTSFVTADFGNKDANAFYINQPALHFARDYFVKPQFIDKLQGYAADIRNLILAYADNMGLTIDRAFCYSVDPLTDYQCAQQVAEFVVSIERSIAMASWPDTEMRNYQQQYNPFDDLNVLDARFKDLYLANYVRSMLDMKPEDQLDGFKVVLSQPTYFGALDALFESGKFSIDDYINYLAIHFLLDNANEIGIDIPEADPSQAKTKSNRRKTRGLKFDRYITRRGMGARRISRRPLNSRGLAKTLNDKIRTDCIDTMIDYFPYGPGYTYVRNRDDKYDVRKDVQAQTENIIAQFGGMINSLDWMTTQSKDRAHAKSNNLVRNYLWPDSVFGTDKPFDTFTVIDGYNKKYSGLDDTTGMSIWGAIKELKKALMATEQWDIVRAVGDRSNFLQSPATVNAWYQPERNSITLPFGILNPPFYNLAYPQAYNYGGQAGVGGHEVTHGYDDEGTQFDEFGLLADCEFTHCSIFDDYSRSGFVDMAQCVVQQFTSQCCPLKKGNVRCANGDTTQGENIADIGGEQAAYKAYNQLMADERITEKRLPGLEQFTPKQIFWMTYGGTWCMKITDDRLVKQLMTDVHSPSSCRVNQVMQDIPQFGQDFMCKRGKSAMYPNEDDRCKVWVGV